ncbi:MAG: DUF4097 family beta strand repeat-containing protein [Eubacterium sp.]|nr:DUF4097 family beta strand repeat-containing protein [Eubacterium sp.]
MSTNKKLVIIAVCLLGAGLLVSGFAFAAMGFDFSKMGNQKMVTNEFEITESFKNISISGDTEDIKFVRATDGKCKVVCYENEEELHDVTVTTGTLAIEEKHHRIWHFGFSSDVPTITLYLPDAQYETIRIDTDTGDSDINDLKCRDFYLDTDTGDVFLKNVIASGEYHMELDTGDVMFDKSDAKALFVETDTGDIRGTLLSDKVFLTESDTGDINVPKAITGGRCELTTDTGDIDISIVK